MSYFNYYLIIGKIGDILLERVNGNDIKIVDFGLAQRIIPGIRYTIEFGHPEFVAPEILDKQSASYVADVWSGKSSFLNFSSNELLF